MFIKEACVGIWYYHCYFKWLQLTCNLIKWSKKYKHQTGDTLLRQFYLEFKSNRQKIPRYKKKTQSVFCQDKRQLYVIWNRQNKEEWEKRGLRIKQRHFLRRQCTNKTSKYQTKATTELCNEGILSKLSWCLSCYCVLWYTKLLYDVMMLWLRRS